MMTQRFAVIGATGLVGHEILNILAERGVPADCAFAVTSARMSGREFSYGEDDLKTIDVDKFNFDNIDVVFVTDGLTDTQSIIKKIIPTGAKIIDCTGRMDGDIAHDTITQLPSSNALQMIEALKYLHAQAPIKRIVVSTYQAVSTEGKAGMDELFNQSRKFFVTDGLENSVFSKQISFNVIPHVGHFMKDGQTNIEWQIAADIKKHLDKAIKVTATCVIAPIFVGSGMAINVEFDGAMDAKTAKSIWRDVENIIVIDEGSEMEYITPAEIAGEDNVYASRLRDDSTVDNGLSFWCVADNIRFMAIKSVAEIEI